MTSSGKIARKQRGSQMHKEFQRVRIPRRERIEIERGLRAMDFKRYYDMRHLEEYEYIDVDGVKHTDELEDHYLPVMLSHGNQALRSVEHKALRAILGRDNRAAEGSTHSGEKYCGGCHEWHLLNDYIWSRNAKRKDGYQNWCKDYTNGYQASYRKKKRQNTANSGK